MEAALPLLLASSLGILAGWAVARLDACLLKRQARRQEDKDG